MSVSSNKTLTWRLARKDLSFKKAVNFSAVVFVILNYFTKVARIPVYQSDVRTCYTSLLYHSLNNAQCTHFHAQRCRVAYSCIGLLHFCWNRSQFCVFSFRLFCTVKSQNKRIHNIKIHLFSSGWKPTCIILLSILIQLRILRDGVLIQKILYGTHQSEGRRTVLSYVRRRKNDMFGITSKMSNSLPKDPDVEN